jgi:hypothetical protein
MTYQQDLSRVALIGESANYKVLSKSGNVNAFNRIDTLEFARRLCQQINYRTAAFNVAGWRFDLHERTYKRLNFRLPL